MAPLSKTLTGAEAGWQGPVVLDAACTDGTIGSLTTAAGATGTVTGSPILVRRPATCTVTETSNGQNKDASLYATTVVVDSGSAVASTKASVHVASGSRHGVAFTDEYAGTVSHRRGGHRRLRAAEPRPARSRRAPRTHVATARRLTSARHAPRGRPT